MKKFLSFLQYHNFIPLLALVLVLGAGSAWAMTGGMPGDEAETPGLDASLLLETDLDSFDFAVTVSGVTETDTHYTVSYAMRTLAPAEGGWGLAEKAGEFSIAKDSLDQTGIEGAVVNKLRDLEAAERGYLARAKAQEQTLANSKKEKRSILSSLIGKQPDDIKVPEPERPYFEMPKTEISIEDLSEDGEENASRSNPSTLLTASSTEPMSSSTPPFENENGTPTPPTGDDVASSTLVTLSEGCTDPEANNYDESAEKDDGSCVYPEPEPTPQVTEQMPTAETGS